MNDWIDLGRSTARALRGRDVASLYELEWPEAKRTLMADHASGIEAEPRRLKRWLRTVSAIMFGLTRRLAPQRRVLFVSGQLAFILSSFRLVSGPAPHSLWPWTLHILGFLAMTLLLAMELIDKIKFRDELELARDLQAGLLPKELPSEPWFDLAAFNLIANTVGGDVYDFVSLPDGRLAVLFGDASGHGMAAGLVMAVAHAAFRTQLDIDPSPGSIMSSLNRILCRTGGPRSFFSCCYVLVSPDGTYSATVAGHPQILHVDEAGRIGERIGKGSYPLGVKIGLTWTAETGLLSPGELLLMHSDGLTETRNAAGQDFGDAYLETILGWRRTSSAREVLDDVVGEWRAFSGRGALEDDVTLAIVRRT